MMRDYEEIVTLLVPGDAPRTLSLADSLFVALHIENRVKRIGAMILLDSGEQIGHDEMEEIYRQFGFSKGQFQTETLSKLRTRPRQSR